MRAVWWLSSVCAALMVTAIVLDTNANLNIAYSRAHPVVNTRVVWRTKTVYRWSPDINALLYRGHVMCRGDMGLSAMLVFPAMPGNAEFLCSGQHEAYTEAGLRL